MRKYLMTWYGMTDFRASLALEETTGPILGALLAEDYTDVIILGFTHPDKARVSESEFQRELSSLDADNANESRTFVNRFANTTEAHEHFKRWLTMKLYDAERKLHLALKSIPLKHLNDTEGIYEAATQSLNIVGASEGDQIVTLYLSPGTPVMAFVWAFAALRSPNLKKRLIASSQFGRPPEEVILPSEWLEWHGRQVRTINNEPDQYGVIFHLFGEQRMPSLLAINQFISKKHIFVNSKRYPADVMKQFLGGSEYGEVAVDPYDPEQVRSTLLTLIEGMSEHTKVGFNLTGGTKLMYAGALAACRKVNATPFYLDSLSNQIVYLNNFKRVDIKPISSVETFIKVNTNDLFISKEGHWDDIPDINNPSRTALTKQLWKNRSNISKMYKKISDYNDKPGVDFHCQSKNISVSLTGTHRAEVIIRNHGSRGKKIPDSVYRFQNWKNFAQYLSGGWLEEYTFMRLCPLVDEGLIKDMRIGLEVSFKENKANNNTSSMKEQLRHAFGDTYQELDVTFTDGYFFYVVECKAGFIRGEYISKLQTIARYFGGNLAGKGILACCFSPTHPVTQRKAKESTHVELMAGGQLFEEIIDFIRKTKGNR